MLKVLPFFTKFLESKVPSRSLVATTPFIPNEQFPWAALPEQHWDSIRSELDVVLNRIDEVPNFQDLSTSQRRLTNDDQWKTFFLIAYGHETKENCARCPQTTEILRQIPGVTTAFFSILGPHKHIPEHRGPYRGVIRYHLGVKVPSPSTSCGIKVGGQVENWSEGAGMFFDDTYPHEAWNESDQHRVVLFLDVVRPMQAPYSWLNSFVIWAIGRSDFVREIRSSQKTWQRQLTTLVRP